MFITTALKKRNKFGAVVTLSYLYNMKANKHIANQGTKTATYFNKATNETYKMGGIRDMEHAYNMYAFVCSRNNWNASMFAYDVIVTVK